MYRKLRVCSGGGGFEAVPEPGTPPLALEGVRRRLAANSIPFTDARVLLIARLPVEVTISRGGRLLFKTRDPASAEAAFERLRSLLGLDGFGPGPGST